MKFNVPSFTVKARKSYRFVLENPDHMLHNLVIAKPRKAVAVGEMSDAMAKHYVPESDDVLFATEQIPHGGRFEKEFPTSTQPGKYPVICTFPGHWHLMKGVMVVE